MKYFWYNPHVNIKFGKLDYKYHLDDWTIIECNIGRINFELYCDQCKLTALRECGSVL